MTICKAPTLLLKALNKHTHIMYIKMENVIKKKRVYINKCSRIIMQKMHMHTHVCMYTHTHACMHAHTHTHTHCTN